MEKSEKEIIERLNAKDKQAFEYVFIQFYNSLCYFADKYVFYNKKAGPITSPTFPSNNNNFKYYKTW